MLQNIYMVFFIIFINLTIQFYSLFIIQFNNSQLKLQFDNYAFQWLVDPTIMERIKNTRSSMKLLYDLAEVQISYWKYT